MKKRKEIHHSIEDMRKNEAIVNILCSSDGNMYKVINNEIGLFSAKAMNIPGLDKWSEGFKLALPKKIPIKLLYQAIKFFKSYCNEDFIQSKEAMVQIFWDREKQEYFIYVPKQIVRIDMIHAERNYELESKHLLVMDIHSHNNMKAYFSPTDDRDERATRIYAVVGSLENLIPDIYIRISAGGDYTDINIFDVFENPFDVEVPIQWHDQIIVK
jgi:hypothetical protein